LKILSVVGARPQFVKLAPVDRAIRAAGHEHVIVHTGQHYAPELSAQLFDDLAIPSPDVNLGVGSGTHATQTARMMLGLEPLFLSERPDWVLVYGDTNSTAAAAMAAVKIHQPIAHLEAGLRSGNRRMPEEHNRVVTDHLADLLLAPTTTAMDHLRHEGLAERAVDVGDVMTDVCFDVRDSVSRTPPAMPVGWKDDGHILVSTIHRAENTDTRERLAAVLDGIEATGLPVLLVAHPRLVAKADEFGLSLERSTISPIPSMSYSQMVYAVGRARGVVTDSGGLQKEAFLLRTPCVTVRTETEWPETLVDGWNVLDPALSRLGSWPFETPTGPQAHPFGDGHAAELVVRTLER
jgi:UDP-N-acetylglucosamine 2-epimerase (non-hydrolysing)